MCKWTEEEENQLKELVLLYSYDEISLLLKKTRNGIAQKCSRLKIYTIKRKSNKCEICDSNIHHNNKICPKCGYKFDKNCKSFAEEYPEVLKEWDYQKNTINPHYTVGKTHKEAWWICNQNHSYKMHIIHRIKGHGCPYCSNPPKAILMGFNDLASQYPEVCGEWDYDKNDFLPSEITKKSAIKVWWKCSNNHSYIQTVANKIQHSQKCPYCSGRLPIIGKTDLATTYPELLNEWDYEKNTINPTEISFGSTKKIWWICKYGHSYNSNLRTRTKLNCGCPICNNKSVLIGYNDAWTTNQNLCKELLNIDDGYKYTQYSNKKLDWKCSKCDYIWNTSISNRSMGTGCPKCNSSKGEKRILEVLNKYNIKNNPQQIFEKCQYKRKLKFDFYLPLYNTCIEYQGEQHSIEYHNVLHPKGTRHDKSDLEFIQYKDQIKRDFCTKEGIKLIEINYWEYDNIETILKKELNI
jgi:hypothetical protein